MLLKDLLSKTSVAQLDSDNDGRSDACEAGPNHKESEPPVDSDLDGHADFIDVDSDNDGILDKDEDKNLNCKVDQGETDPLVRALIAAALSRGAR